MRARLRRVLRRTLAVLLGLTLVLAALEVVLRLNGVPPRQRNPLRGFHVAHERVGWLGAPDYAARFIQYDFDVLIAQNELGFRRAEVERPEDAPAALFLGDSFTWGWGVGQGEVFTDVLQERLGASWALHNMGVNSFGTGQQLLVLEEFGPAVSPERVYVMFFANDLEDNVDPKGRRRPWWEVVDGGLVTRNVPVERAIAGWSRGVSRRSVAISFIHYNTNVLLDRIKHARRTRAAEQQAAAETPVEPGGSLDLGTVNLGTGPEPPDDQKRVFAALLDRLAAACAALPSAPTLTVVIVPERREVRTGATSKSSEFVLSACEARGIATLDLGPHLHAAWKAHPDNQDLGVPILFPHDGHWSPVGHATVAEVLARELEW